MAGRESAREPSDELEEPGPPSLEEAVEGILDRLRPALVADGGNVELLGVDSDGTVRLSFQGQCATCPAQQATLRIGLGEPLLAAIPALSSVVAI